MPPLTREQLVQYIKSLEVKIKKYQVVLKRRDAEIDKLKNDLDLITNGNGDPSVKPDNSAIESAIAQPKLKTKPLEERTKTFIKKANLGADERAKQAVQAKTTSMELFPPTEETPPPPSPDIPIPDQTEEAITAEAQEEEAAPPIPLINFEAGEFLSAVLDGEEEIDEVKALLDSLDKCEPDKRRNIMLSLTSVYWRMTVNMAKRMARENLCWEKRLCMRYGMLDEKLMADKMDVWQQLYMDKSKPEDTGIYFVDEWYEAISRGELKYSTIDEMSLGGAKPDPHATGAVALSYEVMTVPQMQRMCVGPRANMITILAQDYCNPSRDTPIVNRKWLQTAMKEVLPCDHLMFHRKYKGKESVVKPLFIINPGYGQRAGCWEPYTPGKKGDTGPRICISAFPPRSSIKALILGLSDYRWEYAKADAMHYWLTEGMTGKWIALFNKKEQRKDLKEWFQDSFTLWVMSESRRIPKLEKRFREFFWHNLPFADEVKDKLRGGGMFGRLIELEEAKKKRDEEERIELERIKAEREARKAKRQSQQG